MAETGAVEFESPHPAAASPSASCPRDGGHRGRAPPTAEPGAVTNRWSHRRSHPAVPPMCNVEHGPSDLPRPYGQARGDARSRLIGTFGATVVSDASTSPVGGR